MITRSNAQAILYRLGFDHSYRNFTSAVKGFQKGWNLGTALTVDGILGPKTSDALLKSEARRKAGRGTMSANFSFVEFRCKCGDDGTPYTSCDRIWVLRAHVRRLEAYRAKVNKAIRIISGCRCTSHNRAVGGATKSQHLFGGASDIYGLVSLTTLRSYGIFAGLGYQRATNRVVHVDSRDLTGNNTTGGRPSNPTTWPYG